MILVTFLVERLNFARRDVNAVDMAFIDCTGGAYDAITEILQ
jgi:hypothetical protein